MSTDAIDDCIGYALGFAYDMQGLLADLPNVTPGIEGYRLDAVTMGAKARLAISSREDELSSKLSAARVRMGDDAVLVFGRAYVSSLSEHDPLAAEAVSYFLDLLEHGEHDL